MKGIMISDKITGKDVFPGGPGFPCRCRGYGHIRTSGNDVGADVITPDETKYKKVKNHSYYMALLVSSAPLLQ